MSSWTTKSEKIVFVSGIFNALHPGHIRLFKFAAEQGSKLVIGLQSKAVSDGHIFSDEERIQALESINLINDIVLFDDIRDCLQSVRPDVVIKGSEFRDKDNPEIAVINQWHGKLIFSSGESQFTSRVFIKNGSNEPTLELNKHYSRYIKHHEINKGRVKVAMSQIKQMKVAVIGDVILDEYVDCDPVGLSREDPTIVVKPTNSKHFIGGAAIVALHAKSFGAGVDFYSVIGNDQNATWLDEQLIQQRVNCFLFKDESRPTTVKRRYRAENKTLLRVNDYRSHRLDSEIEETFLETLKLNVKDYDLIIFSDFSYGMLSKETVTKIKTIAQENNVMMVADSQTSSQRGDLSKFQGASLVTPTEIEARLSVNILQEDTGLAVIIEELARQLKNEAVVITLGADGALILDHRNPSKPRLDSLPALNKNPKDVSGAGDLLLITSSLLLKAGCDIWHSALIGMFASAIHISSVGNTPISQTVLNEQIDKI